MAKIITSKNKFVLLTAPDIYNDSINVNVVNIGNSQSLFSIIISTKNNITVTNPPNLEDYYEHRRPISADGRILYTVPVNAGESIWIYSDGDSLAVRSDSRFVSTPPPNSTYTAGSSDVQW